MKRIVVVGTSGCGKTTLAKRLSDILTLPCIDLDDYFWLPNWQERNAEEFQYIVKKLINGQEWIICGNFSKWRELIWEKAQMIIWLDYSLLRCFFQALLRALKRAIKKESCCNGNYESFTRTFFSKQSILLWILITFKKRKITYLKAFNNQTKGKTYLRFNSPDKTDQWLREVATYLRRKIE